MRNNKWIAVAVLSSVAFAATAASAAQVAATGGGCAQMATQVQAAIDANPSSANLEQARQDQNAGKSFCSNQLFSNGIAAYQHALDALGAKS